MHPNVRGDPLLGSVLLKDKNRKLWKSSYDRMIMGTCHKDHIDDLGSWLYTLRLIHYPEVVLGIEFREFSNRQIHTHRDLVVYEAYIKKGGVK